jgi:hypothetical protein|tara:strand:+ start:143 stop:328 length:186 start_codon:yes stop_codon:yes gene_type:complete
MTTGNKTLVNNLTKGVAILEKQLKVCNNISEITRLELEIEDLQEQIEGAKNGTSKSMGSMG